MRIVMFYHSLISDWNYGNAHFLRGIVSELIARGHKVCVYEPEGGWSMENLLADYGPEAIEKFRRAYPGLTSTRYNERSIDLDQALDGADLVLVHEWNDHALVRRIGEHHDRVGGYCLLFHDTHHRSVSDPTSMAAYDLRYYDGVLAFGGIIRDLYVRRGWARRAWTWHEAADARIFKPIPDIEREGDLVWIGSWRDEERTTALQEFLLQPVKTLGLKARVHGLSYSRQARGALAATGIEYAGWVPNFEVPQVFARFAVTIHVPRRPYVRVLRGIPTIRAFEALACGIPLVSAPWEDSEGLFTPGRDFLIARNGQEMVRHVSAVLRDKDMAQELVQHGRRTILTRHTCAHRVNELLDIHAELQAPRRVEAKVA